MPNSKYDNLVTEKYRQFNDIFLTLPLGGIKDIGMLIPKLTEVCRSKLQNGANPKEIIENFLGEETTLHTFQEKNDYLFRIIQYVERQVVLIDALEDAYFGKVKDINGSGTLSNFFNQLPQEHQRKELADKANYFSIQPVLTAHPTQFYPGRVLAIIHDLTEAIVDEDFERIQSYLMQLGMTPFFKKKRPSPYDEAVKLCWYLQNIFYPSVSKINTKFRIFISKKPGEVNMINVGFWPGGDRDGNPFVTTKITLKVARRLKETILNCYYVDIRKIKRRISFSGVYEHLLEIEKGLLDAIRGNENWNFHSFKKSIQDVHKEIINNHNGVFINLIEEFLDRIAVFGSHFATLDYRQDSREIRKTLHHMHSQIDKNNSHNLLYLFSRTDPLDIPPETEKIVTDTLQSFPTIKTIQALNGEKGCHRYIISNCRSENDVANAYFIARQTAYHHGKIPVDFIPLFETITDLNNSPKIMDNLFKNSDYRRHLKERGDTQTVMLGFSDGTKDGGYLCANWNIFKARDSISTLAQHYGINIIFFDGRGGPPARGGGNTHKYYISLGTKNLSSEIHLTIQGQTISSKFGTREAAGFHLEQLLTAGLDGLISRDDDKIFKEKDRNLLEQMSQISLATYSRLKTHPLFIPFLMEMSPLKYYQRTNISSRPDKRNENKKIEFEQLRAIPFVGAWSQLKQNIPGFYGLGTALHTLEKEGKIQEVKSLYNRSPFFRSLIENSMQSMCKTFFPLTNYMKHDFKYGEFWKLLKHEFDLTQRLICNISGQNELLENNPAIKASITLRENTVLPLLVIQQYALMKLRESGISKEKKLNFEKMVVRSLFGNINASRNSA